MSVPGDDDLKPADAAAFAADAAADHADEHGLTQSDIDKMLGFDPAMGMGAELSGVQALINSALVSYERLPMLEIVFDRLMRLATTSLRNFTSDNVEVSLDSMTSVRFGDYLNSIPLPAVLTVMRAEEWDGFALLTVDAPLIYSVIDVLLGGRRGTTQLPAEGRAFTTIEMGLTRRLIEVVLADAERAFEPLTPVKFRIERMETNPRFAAITRPANAAILVELRIDMEGRGGKIEMLLPYATIEPIREQLLQMYMGEKFGRDPIWEGHLATEIFAADAEIEAVLHEWNMPLSRVLAFKEGETVMFDRAPTDPVKLRSGEVDLTEGQMGHIGRNISIRVTRKMNPPKVTMAAYEAMYEQAERKA